MAKSSLKLFLCLLMVLGLSLGAGAQDPPPWMQPGVRAWYFGGSSGLTGMNVVEAYLINTIAGGNVNYIRHSASEFWTSPKPAQNLVAPVNEGSFWIHPTILQTIASGDSWQDTEILYVARDTYTYATFTAATGLPYNLLPARALFELKAQRQLVKVTYNIPGTYSQGRAFFDADTGLVLLRDTIFEGYTVFFILGEINYDFALQAAFAEDGGPHCGFRSRVAENSNGGGGHTSGLVDIYFGIETRYENKVEMWVQSSWGGPGGTHPLTFENYYFDGNVPILRRINHDQAGNLPPDQWTAFGQYLPWWLPPTVTQGAAFAAGSLALSTINVYGVSMTKTADSPLTYTATQNPSQFYFSALYFDSYGYLTKFSARDPTKGLDLDAGYLFGNETGVAGLSYYRSTMGTATPVQRPTIHLSKSSLNFGALQASSPTSSQTVVISNTGHATLNWTASSSQGWLQVSPGSGTQTGIITISVNVSGLPAGTYSGSVSVSDPNASNNPQSIAISFKVYNAGWSGVPFGVFETPVDGTPGIEGSVAVTGWVLDDIEVTKVDIWRDPVGNEGTYPNGYVYIGDAVFVEGARPDVEAAYPAYPLNYRAGWGYMMLTNFLPGQGNGTYRIHAIAYDKDGHSAKIGTKTITCDNAHAALPFGAIDTPAQGGTWSGAQVNFGWALTPMPKSIPTDGSTILLWIDGQPIGHPTYNNYRVDIATLFPGFANSDGAVGYYHVDTTQYTNGVHTIVWSVDDSAQKASGIGSRYFTVVNTAGAAGLGEAALSLKSKGQLGVAASIAGQGDIPADRLSPVHVRKGYKLDALAEPVFPDARGVINIEAQEVSRVEVALGEDAASEGLMERTPDEKMAAAMSAKTKEKTPLQDNERFAPKDEQNYAGYLVVGSELRPLPIGSTLDTQRGVFSWQLGPGFIGDYCFVFIGQDGTGSQHKRNVRVRILPAHADTKE